jgi:hypothetical protein
MASHRNSGDFGVARDSFRLFADPEIRKSLNRRDFVKMMIGAGAGIFGPRPGPSAGRFDLFGPPPTSSDKEWSWREHFEEWSASRDFAFPWDRELFEYPERVMIFRAGRNPAERISEVSSDKRPFRSPAEPKFNEGEIYAHINFRTKKPLDIKIVFKRTPNQNPFKPVEYLGVDGACTTYLNLNRFQSDRVYYQVFWREGKAAYTPFSPQRAFKNPVFNDNPVIYTFGDDHKFDDLFLWANPLGSQKSPVDCGLEAEYFYEFLKNALADYSWADKADPRLQETEACLKNTSHLASAAAVIIKAGIHPDLILKGGDDIGLQENRLERQGLAGVDLESAATALFDRERKYWGIFSPLVPVFQVIGNHDGAGLYTQKTHPYARDARLRAWKQPNAHQSGSPDENYYVVPLANGRVDLIVLDNVSYAGYDEDRRVYLKNPSYHRLGRGQTEWLAATLAEREPGVDQDLGLS